MADNDIVKKNYFRNYRQKKIIFRKIASSLIAQKLLVVTDSQSDLLKDFMDHM